MAAGANFSSPFTNVEGGYSNDSSEVSVVRGGMLENSDDSKQTLNGKPPRHISVVRHSISSTTLVSPTELVSK